jgi:hypothetical protein
MQANIDYALRHWQTGNLYINRHSTGARADQGFGDGFGSESHRGAHGGKTGTQEFLLLNALIRRDPARVVPWERVATDSTGLQRGLDVIDAHLRSSLEAETGDAPEEMMSLRRAIDAGRSYLHESATYFSRRRPAPYKVKGQDDWIESRSIGYVCLRAHPADDPFDLLARVFAAIAAGNQLRVSVPPEGEAIFESYLRTFPFDVVPNFPGVTVHVEDDTALFSCLTNDSARPNALNLLQYTARDRVPMAIFTAAANVGLHIDCREATGDGLVDLISQYRQQSVCNVYHVAGDVSYEQYRRGRACPPSDPLSSTN